MVFSIFNFTVTISKQNRNGFDGAELDKQREKVYLEYLMYFHF